MLNYGSMCSPLLWISPSTVVSCFLGFSIVGCWVSFCQCLHAYFLWFNTQGYNYCHTPKCFRLELRECRSQKLTCKHSIIYDASHHIGPYWCSKHTKAWSLLLLLHITPAWATSFSFPICNHINTSIALFIRHFKAFCIAVRQKTTVFAKYASLVLLFYLRCRWWALLCYVYPYREVEMLWNHCKVRLQDVGWTNWKN